MGLLYDDDRAGGGWLNDRDEERTTRHNAPCIIAHQVDRMADLARAWRGEHITADRSWCVR